MVTGRPGTVGAKKIDGLMVIAIYIIACATIVTVLFCCCRWNLIRWQRRQAKENAVRLTAAQTSHQHSTVTNNSTISEEPPTYDSAVITPSEVIIDRTGDYCTVLKVAHESNDELDAPPSYEMISVGVQSKVSREE